MRPSTLLTHARDAAARGDWRAAHDGLIKTDARQPLHGPDLALLATAAYAAGHVDVTIDAWERLHAEALDAGDRLTAAGAAVRVALHLLFDTALVAPLRGWASRAERLLEGQPDTAVHAWVAVVRSYERLLSGDFQGARAWARRAIDLGTAHDRAAAAIGRVAEARSLILDGDVSRGLNLLNEAAVAMVSGEIDPISTGVVYCEVVCALQGMAQYDLAEQWTQAMERWRQGQPVGSIHGRCRVHRAEILRLRGACSDAEQEALAACDELRPFLRREFGWPLTELGRIRLQRGDLGGAEHALLAAKETGWDPQPGLALLRLAQGDVTLAASQIRDALEHPSSVPSKELPPHSDLRRAPLLEAQVEIAIAAGDIVRAQTASEDLTRVAAAFESRALEASAALARGRVQLAVGDATGARHHFEAAAHDWEEIGAPYESALARAGLARAVGTSATMPRPEAANSVGPDAENIFRHEGEYWLVAFAGFSVRLRDTKGLRYLVRLLGDPGREFHVLDLVTAESAGAASSSRFVRERAGVRDVGDAGELLDPRAKAAYRRRLSEIEQDLEEAGALGDESRAAQANAEREFLLRELARAVGLGGRDRRSGSAAERARVSVTRAIRQSMDRIGAHNRALADHLERTIRTGTYCVYLPDPRVPPMWTF